MRNVKKGTGSVRMCDKGSRRGNRFLDKEHERKEEKTNVRRERKECEREIINLHYRNQPECHGIDRRARQWCIVWSIFLTTNTRTNYCKNPPSIVRTDRWKQRYTAREHNSPHKQTQPLSHRSKMFALCVSANDTGGYIQTACKWVRFLIRRRRVCLAWRRRPS